MVMQSCDSMSESGVKKLKYFPFQTILVTIQRKMMKYFNFYFMFIIFFTSVN